LGLGTTSPLNKVDIRVTGADGNDGIIISRADATTTTNEILGGIGFDSTDGNVPSSILEASAYIAAYAAEDHSTGDKGGYLTFGTAPIDQDDDTVSVERMRINASGFIQLKGPTDVTNLLSGGSIQSDSFIIINGNQDYSIGPSGLVGQWNGITSSDLYPGDYDNIPFTSLFGSVLLNVFYSGAQIKIIIDATTVNNNGGDDTISLTHSTGVNTPTSSIRYRNSKTDVNWAGVKSVTGGNTDTSNLVAKINGGAALIIEFDYLNLSENEGISNWVNARVYHHYLSPTPHSVLMMEGPVKLDSLRLHYYYDGTPASDGTLWAYLFAKI